MKKVISRFVRFVSLSLLVYSFYATLEDPRCKVLIPVAVIMLLVALIGEE